MKISELQNKNRKYVSTWRGVADGVNHPFLPLKTMLAMAQWLKLSHAKLEEQGSVLGPLSIWLSLGCMVVGCNQAWFHLNDLEQKI